MDNSQYYRQDLSRYELKYLIPPDYVEPIVGFLQAYCHKDRYSEQTPGGYYTINSLYFDTDEHLFLQWRMEEEPQRFNMRLRSYGQEPSPPYFAEIKYREGMVIRKTRTAFCASPEAYLEGDSQDEFLTRCRYFRASPQVFTQYKRLAWFSTIDDYARITFDKELRCYRQHDTNLSPRSECLDVYDYEDLFPQGCSIVMELKAWRQTVPVWFFDLIHHFGLNRKSFSKYMHAMNEVFRSECCNHPSPGLVAVNQRIF